MDKPVEFHALDSFEIKGRGTVFTGPLDRDSYDGFPHLQGKPVLIHGKLYKCVGVERFLYPPGRLYKAGEPIGLLVKPLDAP